MDSVVDSKYFWINLSFLDIINLKNEVQKQYCLKMRKDCLKRLIGPLISNLPLHTGFKFSEEEQKLSCKNMLEELFKEYYKRDYSKEEIYSIIHGKRVRKR